MKLNLFILSLFLLSSCKKEVNSFVLTIEIQGQGQVDKTSGTFNAGEMVTLTATPDNNWTFSHWSGQVSSQEETIVVTMNADKTIIANFNPTNTGTTISGALENTFVLGGSLNESYNDIIQTLDGGYLCVGSIQSNGIDGLETPRGESDFLAVKYNNDLTKAWSKVYGGTGTEDARSVVATNDGFLIAGYTKSNDFDISENNGQKDVWIIKIDLNGALIWEKSHGFSGDDESFSIIKTQDGGFFACGYLDVTASNGQGNDGLKDPNILDEKNPNHGIGDYWGMKLDNNGDYIWRRYFGGFNNDKAYDVIETPEGDFIIAGTSESIDVDITEPKGSYDIWLVKVSSTGEKIWEKSYGGNQVENCAKIIPTSDGNYFVLGSTTSNDQDISLNHGFADVWLLKISPDGQLIWEKTYGGNLFESAASIIELQNGQYLLAGNTRSDDIYTIRGQNDILLINVDLEGQIIWEKTYGGTDIDVANALIETAQNTILLAGNSESNDFDIPSNNGFTDAVLLEIK